MGEGDDLRYSLRVAWSPEDLAFVAECPEFAGISALGSSYREAVSELEPLITYDQSTFDSIRDGLCHHPRWLLWSGWIIGPLSISFALTMPCCVALVGIPVYGVHLRLAKAKEEELDRVRRALRGDREAMEDSPVAEDAAQMTVTGLVMYRRMVEDIQEWPIEASEILRFGIYVVIPFFAWVGAALVERAVDVIL